MSQDDVERVARAICIDHTIDLRRAQDFARTAITAYLSAMPQRLSPELIAKLNALASRLTQMGEYEACDLIDTVVERVSAMPQRELLAEALEALDRIVDFHIGDCPMTMEEIDFAKNINWQIRKTARAAADKIRAALDKGEQQP
jgi:hypothetical protein